MTSPDDARDHTQPPHQRHFSDQQLSGRGAPPHTNPGAPRHAAPPDDTPGSPAAPSESSPAEEANPWLSRARAGATPHNDLQGFRLRRPSLDQFGTPSAPPSAVAQRPAAQSPSTPSPTTPAPAAQPAVAPPQPPPTGRVQGTTHTGEIPTTGRQPVVPGAHSARAARAEPPQPSAQDTSERLRAVNPHARTSTPAQPHTPSGPLAGLAPTTAAQPAQPAPVMPGGLPSSPAPRPAPPRTPYSSPAPTEGVTAFTEPGRSHLGVDGAHHAQATPAHLDPRVAGLTNVPARRRRGMSQFFQRSSDAVIAGNPTSNALHAPIELPRRISVVGLKGGVGKTTLSILLSKTAARERRQPVLVLDSDTTYGSLALRTGIVPIASAHDIARMGDPGSRQIFATSIARTEEDVWVLPTGRSPEQSANFTDRTYVETMRAVYRHFPIIVTDCGAGMAGPLMQRVISASHALVIATSPSMDGILASHNALQWLASLGYTDLLQRTIVAMSNVADPPQVDLEATRERFAQLCRGLVTVPTDPHLTPGSFLDYGQLAERTRRAAVDLTSVALEAALSAG